MLLQARCECIAFKLCTAHNLISARFGPELHTKRTTFVDVNCVTSESRFRASRFDCARNAVLRIVNNRLQQGMRCTPEALLDLHAELIDACMPMISRSVLRTADQQQQNEVRAERLRTSASLAWGGVWWGGGREGT